MDKSNWIVLAAFGTLPIVGAASAIIMEKAATKYGHSFTKLGPNNVYLIGIVGAVQNTASIIFMILFQDEKMDRKKVIMVAVLSHALTAVSLTALTALAAKANLISARLTLFATLALTTASLIENMAFVFTSRKLLGK